MKIDIDSSWGKIYDHDTKKLIIDYGSGYGGGLQLTQLSMKIFSKSQQLRLTEHDGTYTLSKKGERILKEEIQRLKLLSQKK